MNTRSGLGKLFCALAAAALLAACSPTEEELSLITAELALSAGDTVADVGAGEGALVPHLSAAVGDSGTVLATEIDPDAIEALNALITSSDLNNVTVVRSDTASTGLAPECCDAIVLRRVYHHLSDPDGFLEDLSPALADDGTLLIVEFRPAAHGHGVEPEQLIADLSRHGFVAVRTFDEWPNSTSFVLDHFAVTFRRAE